MEQLYMIEIFIDKVTVFATENDTSANKQLIVKINFGPKTQFIIREGQLAVTEATEDDQMVCDENGKMKWSRSIRVGKSYLFSNYPDTVMMTLSKFPLELEVWNDDNKEVDIFVGIGKMEWDTQFYHMLKETAEPCKKITPLSIKQKTPIFAECCCRQCGEVEFILRLTAMGSSIITEFQQLQNDPERFVFRTDKAPSMFECKRIEGDDPNFCMVGSIYETTTLEDPILTEGGENNIEVCTDLQTCIEDDDNKGLVCKHDVKTAKKYAIDKIRMGDIVGPCGNPNCALAHKVKTYIRNLDSYKKVAEGITGEKEQGEKTKKICGSCSCKDDRWHRDECPDKLEAKKDSAHKGVCKGCGGAAKKGDTCKDRKKKLDNAHKKSATQITYVFSLPKVPGFTYSEFDSTGTKIKNVNSDTSWNKDTDSILDVNEKSASLKCGCGCPGNKQPELYLSRTQSNTFDANERKDNYRPITSNPLIYNVTNTVERTNSFSSKITKTNRNFDVYNCTDIFEDKTCKCNPPKPHPPCHTTDCDCLAEIDNIASRKAHKPYCPLYKHKTQCPVNIENVEEEKEEEEDEAEPLPYGLPPIKLGPCPVMGRPCSVPDGFARMYKNAALPPQPPSYSDAGKVCCSKEYEKIKKAIKDYMKYEKDHDFRCINKFNVDTERRCCDKEQKRFSMLGKGCCGAHKLSIQEKFKEEK